MKLRQAISTALQIALSNPQLQVSLQPVTRHNTNPGVSFNKMYRLKLTRIMSDPSIIVHMNNKRGF